MHYEALASRNDGRPHLLLACSGSVATIKAPNIITALTTAHPTLSIRLILTASATNFLAGQSAEQPTLSALRALPGVDGIYHDADEWGRGPSIGAEEGVWRRGGGILHIELRRWADLMAVVPLSANTLAKVVNGLCDNLLTSVVRAWDADGRVDGRRKRILVAPAMNTAMWLHPITARQIRVLSEDWGVREDGDGGVVSGWFEVLRPQEKSLACGDVGDGAMKEWPEIVRIIEARMGLTSTS
ncbi:Coenzyme A biosynthesis protein 3 [Cytospora mali]|uniref:Coenzyme A biosynthesis protein 3 n=1 Tax=Cytospora mali TaxID=578113 RepID=A0A194WD52_CYTMA|nr:Coenzyme A biosynthesis protein 3 [Valsa mali]